MSRTAATRSLLGSEVTEKDFMGDVLAAACLLGWRTYHTRDSRGSTSGFPDFVGVRGSRLVMAELKREKGRATEDQQSWLEDLDRVRSVGAYLWRPSDWSELEAVLR
jgi:hypothetical protein